MRRKIALLLVAVMTLSLTVSACGKKEEKPNESSQQTVTEKDESTDKAPVNARVKEIEDTLMKQIGEMPDFSKGGKLGALVISLTNPYWVGLKDAYEAAADEFNIDIDVMSAPTEGDKQSQLETLQGMALKKYDAIVLSPIEPFNLLPGIVDCNNNDIPVVNLGPGVNVDELTNMDGHIDGRLTVNFEMQGEMAAKDIVERIGSGKVAIIQGIPGAGQSEGRTAGAKKVFESTNGIELVSVQPADWDSQKAYTVAADLLKAHPDLKAIFCCNDVMALAASEALADNEAKDGILIYGVDGTEEAKKAIKEGRMDGSITYPATVYAKAAVVMLMKLAQGMEMDDVVYCPLDVINTDNVNEFDGYK